MRLSRTILILVPAAAGALFLATAAPVGADGVGSWTQSTVGTYSFPVPAGVVGVTADLSGAGGGAGLHLVSAELVPYAGAPGGRVVATLSTTPGATLDVVVGGAGGDGNANGTGGAGGSNGGGSASNGPGLWSGGGGGATDIRTGSALTDRVLVAGGGGGTGGGKDEAGAGGAGGGLTGNPGTTITEDTDDWADGGGGGLSTVGGAAGAGSEAGGGMGSSGNGGGGGGAGGGGGGGGWYGGGGGGGWYIDASSGYNGAGGGGGSGRGSTGWTNYLRGGGSVGSTNGSATIWWMTATTLSPTVGAPVTLTSHLPPVEVGDPEAFTTGMTTLCSDVTVASDGTATCTTSALPAGTDDVIASDETEDGAYFGTDEVLEVDVTAATASPTATATPTASASAAATASAVPVPTSGAEGPAGGPGGLGPAVGVLFILAGGAGIAATRRRRRAH
jgi:hypothetical protein